MSRILNVTNCHVRTNDNRDLTTQENYLMDRITCLQNEVARLKKENAMLKIEAEGYREMVMSVSRIVFTDKEMQ